MQPLNLRHVPFDNQTFTSEFEAVGAVGEFGVVDAEGGVGADGLFGGGEGVLAVGVAEEKRLLR